MATTTEINDFTQYQRFNGDYSDFGEHVDTYDTHEAYMWDHSDDSQCAYTATRRQIQIMEVIGCQDSMCEKREDCKQLHIWAGRMRNNLGDICEETLHNYFDEWKRRQTQHKLKVVQDASAARNEVFDRLSAEQRLIAERCIKTNRPPFSKRATNTRTMRGRNGKEFEIYPDSHSFYAENDKQPGDLFIEVTSLTDNDPRNHVRFTYGQMEGARKLLMNSLKEQIRQMRERRKKTKYIKQYLACDCYSLLRLIDQETNGQAEETKQFFAEPEYEIVEIPAVTPEQYEIIQHEVKTLKVRQEKQPRAQVAVSADVTDDHPRRRQRRPRPAKHDQQPRRPMPLAQAAYVGRPREENQLFVKGWRLFREGEEIELRKHIASGMRPATEYGVKRRRYRREHATAKNGFLSWATNRMWQHETGTDIRVLAQADTGSDVSKEQNTIFTDERSTVMDDGYVTEQTEPNMKDLSMQEDQWHVRDIMSKPIPFYHGDWTTGQAQGTIIKQWDIPGDTLLGPHYNQTATFVYWRGHPTIRFQINGTKFHNGRLIAAFIPAFQFTQYDEVLYDVDTLTSLPHVILDAGISNSGVINLPFVHMNTYFNTVQGERGWQSLGRLVLVVFNRLGSATTSSQNIGVTGWVSYDNCELHQPCHAHDVKLPKANKAYGEQLPRAQAAVEGLIKSTLPMITDLVAPGLGSALGAVGSIAGGTADCDKPTDPMEISRWVPNAVTSLSQGTGLDKSSRLSLENNSYTIGDADLISTTTDDMNLLEVAKIPTRLTTLKWSSSDNATKLIAKIPTCPNLYSTRTTSDKVDPPVDIITPTLLAYIARPFKFYRGGLRYKIQLIASQQHSGRILVAFAPGITDIDFDKATYLNTYVIDLQEKHEVEFVVPYLAERPWLRCDRFRQLDATGVAENAKDNFENTGYLVFYVMNRLSRPDSVAAEIDINILVSAADDFELAVPADLACVQGIGNVVPQSGAAIPHAQALVGQSAVTTRTEEGVITLTKGGGKLGSAAASTLSENAMNLKTLLRRYYKVFTNKFTLPGPCSTIGFENTPTLSSVHKCFNNKNGVQMRTHLAHFSELFTFWRGSLRYKLVWSIIDDTNFPALTVKVFHIPGSYIYGNFTPANKGDDAHALMAALEAYGTLLAQTNIQSSLEFEVPMYTPYTQLRTIQGAQPNGRSVTGVIVVVFDKPMGGGEPQINLDLYQAAGDDFGLNYLRAAPRVQSVQYTEKVRQMNDVATFIYENTPTICKVNAAPAEDSDDEDETPRAQGWTDHIPVVGDHVRATRSIEAAGNSLSGVCDTAAHLMQQAATKVGLTDKEDDEDKEPTIVSTVTDTLSAVSDPILSIFTTLSEYLKELPKAIGIDTTMDTYTTLVDVAGLIVAFKAYKEGGAIIKAMSLITICAGLFSTLTTVTKNALYHFATSIISNLYGSKQGNGLPAAQSDVLDFIAPLTATLSIAVGILGFKQIPSDKETTDIVKGISEKLRLFNFSSMALNNVKTLWTQLKEIFDWIVAKIIGMYDPVMLAHLKLKREFEDIEQWAAFVDSLTDIDYEDRIHYDPEFKKKVYRAIDTGKKYNAYLVQGKIGREANVVREYVRKALEISTKCDKSKNTLPFRKDPFCIAMYGKTGVGKSGIITELGFTLMDELNYPRHNRWCAINCNDKFFNENYTQQAAVYFDDFSTFTSEEQYQAFFNLKANTAYPLNMAFKKGEYFNSDFIFMTTNTSHPNPNCLTCIPALWRRRDVLIEADFIEALSERGDAGEFVMREDNSHARYRLANPRKEGEYLTGWMDYTELMVEIHERAAVHLRRQETKLRKDLIRAEYIIPNAEAGKQRKICLEAARNAPSLRCYSPDIWDHIVYDTGLEMWHLSGNAPLEVKTDYEEMMATTEALGLPENWFQDTMNRHSYEVKELQPGLITKIKGTFNTLRTKIGSLWELLEAALPWIKTIFGCVFKLAIAMFAFRVVTGFIGAVAHKCLCFGIRTLGYRCGLCGKWPKLSRATDPEWAKSEWASLYGNEPYRDDHVTPLDEEWTIKAIQSGTKPARGITVGTQAAAQGGPYSDNTNGARITKVVAHGTYNTETKGQTATRILAQAQDKHVTDLISNRIIPCLYRIKFAGNDIGPEIAMNAFAVGARALAVPAHFFTYMRDGEYFEIFHSNAWMEVEFESKKAKILKGKDVCMYEMPIQFHLHKSNLGHFVSEKELAYGRKFPATLVKTNSQLQTVLMETNVEPKETVKYIFDAGREYEINVQDAWKYRLQTQAGDCGAPLLAHCNKLSGRIIGFHVCGTGVNGWATLITREMIEEYVTSKEGSCLPAAHAKIGNLIPPGHFGRIGKSDKIFFQNDATQIIKTDIHNEISAPVTFPAVLSRNDPRLTRRVNPLQVGIGKYSKALRPFPHEHREMVNEFMRSELHAFTRLRRPKLLTELEMVKGIPEFEQAFEPLPMNTSPGWPYVNTRPRGECGKAYLFDINGQMQDKELKQRYAEREERARRGERVESVWIDCMKDERRAIEKIQSGSTRIFTIGPVDVTLISRRYCQDFVESIKASRTFSHCKLGIDPQSMEWTELYTYLASFSDCMVAGDFTRFDGTVHGELIEDYFDDIDYFYKEFGDWTQEDSNVRKVLADEICNTIQLAKDEFYMTHSGNPSGNQQTTPLNSRTNYRYMALAWLGIIKERNLWKYFSMHSFSKNVRIACYGDDNILAIKREVIEWFNQETISKHLEQYGIVYTNEAKDGITKYKTLDECTFLKQGFRDHETITGIKSPIMKESTLLELLNWTRIAPDQDQLLEDNCNDSLRFAYFHGKQYFNDLRTKINAALTKHEKKFRLMTFSDYHYWFLATIGMLEGKKFNSKGT